MNNLKLVLILFCFTMLGYTSTAQSLERTVVASAGQMLTAGGLSLEYTVGEAVVGQFSNSSIILNQGFNQADINTTNSIRSTAPELLIKVWPNPASSQLKVAVDENAKATIYDLSGKAIVAKIDVFKNQEEAIDISKLSSGLYFIKISTASRSSTVMWVKE